MGLRVAASLAPVIAAIASASGPALSPWVKPLSASRSGAGMSCGAGRVTDAGRVEGIGRAAASIDAIARRSSASRSATAKFSVVSAS